MYEAALKKLVKRTAAGKAIEAQSRRRWWQHALKQSMEKQEVGCHQRHGAQT
jgi:predicted transcriptional regulator